MAGEVIELQIEFLIFNSFQVQVFIDGKGEGRQTIVSVAYRQVGNRRVGLSSVLFPESGRQEALAAPGLEEGLYAGLLSITVSSGFFCIFFWIAKRFVFTSLSSFLSLIFAM